MSRRREPGTGLVAGVLVVAMAATALYLGHRSGLAVGFGALAAEAAALVLVGNARLTLLLFLVVGAVAEDDPNWGINLTAVYNHGTAVPSAFEALEGLACFAVLLYLASTRLEIRLPSPFAVPMTLTAAALLAGLITGASAGVSGPSALLGTFEDVIPLLIVPLLIVNVIRTRAELRQAVAIGTLLVAIKAIAGLLVYFSGLAPVQGSFGRITYFEAPANLLMMMFLFAMLVAWVSGIKVPRRVAWITPLVVLALVLSYRRTVWLGIAVATPLLVFVGSGRVARRFIVPSLVVIVAVGYIVLSTGIGGGLQGSLAQRAESISLAKISESTQDRYRIDERHNVLAAIERSPLTGLGIGVAWPMRYPVGVVFPDQTQFTHIGALLWWMKMGLLGLAAYVALIGSVILTGLRIWRGHSDPHVRLMGLAATGLAIGWAVVELANTVLGAEERGAVLFGAVMGLLAVAHAQLGLSGAPEPADTVGAS